MEFYIKVNKDNLIIGYRFSINENLKNYHNINVPDEIANDIFSGEITSFVNGVLIYKNGSKFDTNDVEKEELRKQRKILLQAFDIWEKAVLRGREEDSRVIMKWYEDLLNLKSSAFEDENVPEKIKYYM